MLYSGIYIKLYFSGVITKSTSHYTIILHEHVPVVCMTKVSTALLRVAFLAGCLRVFWKLRRLSPKIRQKYQGYQESKPNPNQSWKNDDPQVKFLELFSMGGSLSNSKVILLLVCQGTYCCHGGGMGHGVGSDVENPQRCWDILKWSKGLIPSGTWQGLYQSYYLTMLHLHISLGVGSLLARRYVAVCWKWRNHWSPTDPALRCLL